MSQAVAMVRAYEAAEIAPYFEGPSGIGKSEGVAQLCAQDGILCVDVRLALLNPVDLRGIPVVRNERVEWVPPVFLKSEPCRFFLDEMPNAVPATPSAAYQWILDHGIGEWRMKRDWHETPDGFKRPLQTIIAAGNRAADRAFVNPIAGPLMNRMGRINVEPDIEGWREWAWSNGVDRNVINFITFTARDQAALKGTAADGSATANWGLLHWFDAKVHSQAQFPTPRGWVRTSRFITANPGLKHHVEGIEGIVGQAAATKFVAFSKVADKLPNADDVVQKGKIDLEPPSQRKEPGALYAYCGALVASAIRTPKEQRVQAARNLAAYCVRHWAGNAQEFAALTYKDFARTKEWEEVFKKVLPSAEWKSFTKAFKKLMIA
jgi:MoxR-like ATPase